MRRDHPACLGTAARAGVQSRLPGYAQRAGYCSRTPAGALEALAGKSRFQLWHCA